MRHPHRTTLIALASAALLAACGGGDDHSPAPPVACVETGPYACQSGETEPLYTFQWALNYLQSFFATHADAGAYGGGLDLNVEPVHRQGIKGQGVKVLVIDSGGVDLEHEDLAPNADYGMSWNVLTRSSDPSPLLTPAKSAHGTNIAGIIGAAQNGKGVMGIAPQVRIGGAAIDYRQSTKDWIDTYGGAVWSQQAHVMNASYGSGTNAQEYSLEAAPELIGIRSLKPLRGSKGIVFVKAAGNSFDESDQVTGMPYCGPLYGAYDCTNPGNDVETLEPNVIVTAALNAKGQASSYSSAGSVVWITGMGGEYAGVNRINPGGAGRYGEKSGLSAAEIAAGRTGDGPTIFSTDIRGCSEGYSTTDAAKYNEFMGGLSERVPGVKDNPNCDYGHMNGTSSAAPTISGVVALMLSANPELSWRDVRDILRLSSRAIDQGYETRTRNDMKTARPLPYGALFDLRSNDFVAQAGDGSHIRAGATQVPVELGWTRNAAGALHSNWYGFGVPDTARAVELAQLYKKEPARSKPAQQAIPPFTEVAELEGFDYQRVSLLGVFEGQDQIVDQFQLRISAEQVCLGSLGLAVESPAGTKSLLKMPLDHFVQPDVSESDFDHYGAGSYAFYGENAKGQWKIYALASNPRLDAQAWGHDSACDDAPADGLRADDAWLGVEARVIAQ